ncbi:histidine kinase N-terminal 7TM domain-containing protein [Armatimonas rosea]|uniref:Histidine kinase N-terminal 7TM region domain-containing protein n=1 Tax=Armatimonas rosea TaxID=685828 RepID=A0A7W9SQ27_ARMRO|nr:histidine kinase N-terminal 7TM domain-containing protein [Armatimonas rosea]MBB6050726.1 hypothetical protein [Armatimonas rosea]
MGWTLTLYYFQHYSTEANVLTVGRLNFAMASLAVYGVYRLVRDVAHLPARIQERQLGWITAAMALVSAFTPWVDAAEVLSMTPGESHQTIYGPVFSFYVLHLLVCLGGAIILAFRERGRRGLPPHVSDQLLLLGVGILGTGSISLISNVLIPYINHDFRWIDIGPLSTLVLLLCVAYAVVRHQLFDIRIFLSRTLGAGMALSLILAVYSALVLLATEKFASLESGGVTRFGVLVLAFSFDPIRRFLEKRIDRLLFSEHHRAKSEHHRLESRVKQAR